MRTRERPLLEWRSASLSRGQPSCPLGPGSAVRTTALLLRAILAGLAMVIQLSDQGVQASEIIAGLFGERGGDGHLFWECSFCSFRSLWGESRVNGSLAQECFFLAWFFVCLPSCCSPVILGVGAPLCCVVEESA